MDCPPKKNGRCREVAVSGSSTVLNECNKMGCTSSADFVNFWVDLIMRIPVFTIKHGTKKQRVLVLKKAWFRPELNWRPSACKADVITTTLRNHSLPCWCFFLNFIHVRRQWHVYRDWHTRVIIFCNTFDHISRVDAKTHTNHLTRLVAMATIPPLIRD